MHIRAKTGEPIVQDWDVTWQVNNEVGPFIHAENKKLEMAFGKRPFPMEAGSGQ
jgi:hypothetical protein